MLIVNASNTDKDLAHFAKYLPDYECTVTNITDTYSSIAVQGPDSEKILKVLSGGAEISGPKKNDLNELDMEGHTDQAQLQVEDGCIQQARFFSDAMDWEIAPKLEAALTGCRLEENALRQRLENTGLEEAAEVCRMLSQLI